MNPDIKIQVKFSDKVTKSLKTKLEQDIMRAVEGSPEMRKEIKRVFQMANRRIQNIEKAGVLSPALQRLNLKETDKFSKFAVGKLSNKGEDWAKLKHEYSKAVAFLNQPTSTATGAKEWEKSFRQHMTTDVFKAKKIDDDIWHDVKTTLLNDFNNFERKMFEKLPYQRMMQDFYQKAVESSGKQMERTARDVEKRIQANIKSESRKAAKKIEDELRKREQELLKKFGFDEF